MLDTLDTYFEMESDDYQIRWDKIATDSTKTARLASIKPLEVYEGMLKRRRLHTMAVGEDSTEGKIYSYGRYVCHASPSKTSSSVLSSSRSRKPPTS